MPAFSPELANPLQPPEQSFENWLFESSDGHASIDMLEQLQVTIILLDFAFGSSRGATPLILVAPMAARLVDQYSPRYRSGTHGEGRNDHFRGQSVDSAEKGARNSNWAPEQHVREARRLDAFVKECLNGPRVQLLRFFHKSIKHSPLERSW